MCGSERADRKKPGMVESPRRHEFLKETGLLFEAIVVIYSVEFQKTPKVERTRKAGLEVFGNQDLYSAYQGAWQTLPDFCKSPRAALGWERC